MSEASIEAASRLGQVLQVPVIGSAVTAAVDPSTARVVAEVRNYGGRQIDRISAGECRPQIVIVEPEALPRARVDRSGEAEIIEL
jgi:hypothetical protein